MEINIKYEDNNLIVVEKPFGVVVHPGAGECDEILTDWLLSKYPEIKKLDWPDQTRPGIVHRLDKDTSGLLIIAKNPKTLLKLQKQFQEHKVTKKYKALVLGKFEKDSGEIESYISRDPHARRKQSSNILSFDFLPGAKRFSKTRYKVIREYQYKNQLLSFIEASLDTGRTHQIRVQFKSIGHPLVGDHTYSTKASRHVSKELNIYRQFLHAHELKFNDHHFTLDLPEDLQKVLDKLS